MKKNEFKKDERVWNIAKTVVFEAIEEQVLFCKKYAKARIFVDDCGIGKTFSAKYLSQTLKNCFYIDASQCKNKQLLIRSLAHAIGLENIGKYVDVKNSIKNYLHILTKPVIIIDEAGDLDYNAFLELKELWNATEGVCGWYMMGADGLRAKIERGISAKKVGYKELFSRFSERYGNIVPIDQKLRMDFYRQLISDVLVVNVKNKSIISEIVKKCLVKVDGNIGGLRRAESLLILNS